MNPEPNDREDLYAVLGVPPSATAEEVRAAYRVLAHRYHPDHNPDNPDAEQRMQAINRAFGVLNSAERRAQYDEQRLRAQTRAQAPVEPKRGAGRGQRPYYRGRNWGLHTGADAPPEFIVRAEPSSFNLVVSALQEPPCRAVRIHNDAPFSVRMAAVPSPWLTVSEPLLEVEAGGDTMLLIAASPAAAQDQRGWRDGGVSLFTDDPRVFCPDVRVTAIFMGRQTQQQREQPADGAASPDLRTAERPSPPSSERGGWRKLFGL
ncbi:MAG TPA: J domain-containing protein [Dehalococcoidia bacterium]|nr:J domain-containing protein [Dehalococcoidia bacterium]